MAGAPYTVMIDGTDDETFTFTLPFEEEDGSDFPFGDYVIEYALRGSRCGTRLFLTAGAGITVLAPNVTFRAPEGRLRCGRYEHGCRMRHIVTGIESQIFDGVVTISEGGFR